MLSSRNRSTVVYPLSLLSLALLAFVAICIGSVREIRLSTDLTVLTLNVTDTNGRAIRNLNHEDFTVIDKNKLQQIAFFTDEESPKNIGIVFDRSRSARKAPSRWLSSVSQAIMHFQDESNAENKYFIIGAGTSPQLVTDWTRDSGEMVDGLSTLPLIESREGGVLFDACRLAIEKLEVRGTLPSAIVVISDGQDGSSRTTRGALINLLKRTGVPVYSICPANRAGSRASHGRDTLRKLSVVSGGATFFLASANEVAAALSSIASELRHQYLIGYYPLDNKHDGSWHSVSVAVNTACDDRPQEAAYIVRTRPGYYAPRSTR